MEKLINKQSVLEVAKWFTFTFAEERQRYMDFLECCLDNATYNSESLTNADKIRNMTDEELTEFMYKYAFSCKCNCPSRLEGCYENCKGRILEWLKSEVGCE